MCAIVGYFDLLRQVSKKNLELMLEQVSHRGPDNSGILLDKNLNIGLAHARLSIMDLSKSGHQPMSSHDGRYTLVFNGEIYNHLKLRRLITEYEWNGTSDTETLLACLQNWGLTKTLEEIDGMYSFGILDRAEKKITLSRDPFGEKPLYYGQIGASIVFASDIAAFKKHPEWQLNVNKNALNTFLHYGAIQAPDTIFSNISQLEPGTTITFSLLNGSSAKSTNWDIQERFDAIRGEHFTGNLNEAANQLDSKLFASVKSRMLSDAPIGAFLSGGIDSSLVVAMMQKISNQPVNTYTIGFEDKSLDESSHASKIAKALGTNHETLIFKDGDVLDTVQTIPKFFSEPFADPSQIPTLFLSKFVSRDVKVALSGDGGDELFYGYNRYIFIKNYWPLISRVPIRLRQLFVSGLDTKFSNITLKRAANILGFVNQPHSINKIKLAISSRSEIDVYRNFLMGMHPNLLAINGADTPSNVNLSRDLKLDGYSSLEVMNLLDFLSYLPNDILVKVDRASMAYGLEVRSPFLNKEVLDFSLALPKKFKIQKNTGKVIAREVLKRYIDPKFVDRPKRGFGSPIGSWMSGELKPWIDDLFDPGKVRQQGYLNEKSTQRLWQMYLAGNGQYEKTLWNAAMFQSWLRSQ